MDDNRDGRPAGSAFSPDAPGSQGRGDHKQENTEGQDIEVGQHEDMQSLMDAEEAGGFRSLRRGQTATGVVVSIREDAVLVDVGLKSEGVIPRQELFESDEEEPDLQIGQEILVHVVQPDSPEGPILSLRRARRERAWADMEQLATSGGTIEAPIVDHNRGGALLDVRGLRGFVPLSQLTSLAPAAAQPAGEGDDTQDRLAALHGQRLKVKVLEANQAQNRLILSERAAEQEARAQRKEELLRELEPGQIRHGRIRNVTNFGAFVDLGGADGLVHVSEISYDRIYDPRTALSPGQEVDVYVLEVRPDDQKIALSLKRAMTDPWITLPSRHEPGETVQATITRLAKFGAFAQVEPGIEGLIHVTELAEVTPRDPGQVVHEGQTVDVKIIHIDQVRRRLGLSLRQVHASAAEPEMTPEAWAQEQARDSEPQVSAFGALAALADSLPAEATSTLDEPEEVTPSAQAVPEEAGAEQSTEALEEALIVEGAAAVEEILAVGETRDLVESAAEEGAITADDAAAADEALAVDEVVALEEVMEIEEALAVEEVLEIEEARRLVESAAEEGTIPLDEAVALDEALAVDEIVALEEVAEIEEALAVEEALAIEEDAAVAEDLRAGAEAVEEATAPTDEAPDAVAVAEAAVAERAAADEPATAEEVRTEDAFEAPSESGTAAEATGTTEQETSNSEPVTSAQTAEQVTDSSADAGADDAPTPESAQTGDETPSAASSNHAGADRTAEARDRVHDAV
jgi:small subunit ribosomal protein S1